MHPFTLDAICQYFNLGKASSQPIPIAGGFQHQIWQLQTSTGIYAIKLLDTELINLYGAKHFQQNENFAHYLQQNNVPTCHALQREAAILIRAGNHYLVYPWIKGERLAKADISLKAASRMGSILANIHTAAYQAEHSVWPKPVLLPEASTWQQYHEWLKAGSLKTALSQAMSAIVDVVSAYRMMQPILSKQRWVYSHTDLTPANVIWQNDQPTIIDWELAGPIMPEQDVLATALNWSLDNSGNIRWSLYDALLAGYQQHQPLPAASRLSFIAMLADWLNWAAWNLERVFDINLPESKRQISADQAEYSLLALCKVYPERNRLLAKF